MELKKFFLSIFLIFESLFICSAYEEDYDEDRYVTLNYNSTDYELTNETILFKDKYVKKSMTLKSKNSNTNKFSINLEIMPCSDSYFVLPQDFKIKINGKESKFDVFYENQKIDESDYYRKNDTHLYGRGTITIIEFEASLKANTENILEISYLNFHAGSWPNFGRTINFQPCKDSIKKIEAYPTKGFNGPLTGGRSGLSRIYDKELDEFKYVSGVELPENADLENSIINASYSIYDFSEEVSSFLIFFPAVYAGLDNEHEIISGADKNLSKQKLTERDIFFLGKKQLRLLRNAFYAIHGYSFKNEELKSYFNRVYQDVTGKPYKINPDFSEADFNEVEKYNINLIKEMENTTEPLLYSDCIK